MDTYTTIADDVIYCPTRTFDWPRAAADMFRRHNLPGWPQLNHGTAIPFYRGRVALWFLCRLWGLKQGDQVLMPAYNCGSEVDPFLAYGAKVLFYRVDAKTRIDYEDLKGRCTDKTRIVYITHYFGWPHPVRELYKWCKERNICVIEDCALSLFSKGPEGYLGTLADASIFSFRKFLPVPDGAALVLKKQISSNNIALRSPGFCQTIRNLLPFAKSTALSMLSAMRLYQPLRRLKLKSHDFSQPESKSDLNHKPDMPADYYFDRKLIDWSISRISGGILRRTKPGSVIQQRRANYLVLCNELSGLSDLEFLHSTLPNGVCPLACVMKVKDRKRLVKGLNACGIAAFNWWEGYHQQLSWDDFPEAKDLKDSVLYLPIRQSMKEAHMNYIAKCLKSLL